MNPDWRKTATAIRDFGGECVTLHVRKTGLPFLDALQLYGAIDMYVGLREDVTIHDAGTEWLIAGRSRAAEVEVRGRRAFRQLLRGSLKPKPKRNLDEEMSYRTLRSVLQSKNAIQTAQESLHQANGPFSGLDSAMQSGIRGIAAASYDTMKSGQSGDKVCIAQIPLFQGFLALCGKQRTQSVGDIVFLPIFEGTIDLSKVVSPLSVWTVVPNPICAQALMILALKTSLFTEGFQDRLAAVVYNKRVKQGDFAYSGVIAIGSTAVGSSKMKSGTLAADAYYALRRLIREGWENGNATGLERHALAMAAWVMHPVSRNLAAMIGSQEKLHRDRQAHIFTSLAHVKEIFNMSYEWKEDDYETVRRFARAVSSGIFYARMKEVDKREWGKVWFDEVTLLRSAPSPRAFMRRAMYLVEKGHSKHSRIGTSEWDQSFEPKLLGVIGESRNDFEAFRDLFRMYLVQESKPPDKDESGPHLTGETTVQSQNKDQEEEE